MKFKSTLSIIIGVLAVSASFNCFAKWEEFRAVNLTMDGKLTKAQAVRHAREKAYRLRLGHVDDVRICSLYPNYRGGVNREYLMYKNTMLCTKIVKESDKLWHVSYREYRLVL